ncbi:hypothetical protein, partial [Novosphingobium sp.]|uniref:hypothetical protein n=1 Tax=Novosphingobium sp. TaxID=1874826 RepID=UPI0038BCB0AE
GDCSYSTYLIHMFAIRVLVLGSGRLLPSLLKAEVLAITLFCIIATLVAWLCHVLLEKPMTEWIDRKFARA